MTPILSGTDNGVDVHFYYNNGGYSYTEKFKIGYTIDETVTDPTLFTYYDQEFTTNSATWVEYENSFPANTKRIAIQYIYTNGLYLYLDDFTFSVPPSCVKPTSLTPSDILANSATLTWEEGSGTYNVQYKKAADAEWTTHLSSTALLTTTISGLDAQTAYEARVQSVCGGDLSDWRTTSFTTTCAAVSVSSEDYTYGFETADLFECWNVISGTVTIKNSTSNSHNSSYYLDFRGTTSNMVALPPFEEATNTLRVEFWTRPESNGGSSGKFAVGYMTDINDASTFVPVATYNSTSWTSTPAYEKKTVDLVGAPAGARIVFRQFDCSTNYYWYVDDVTVTLAPSCLPPTALYATPATDEAELSWTANSSETTWTLYWKEASATDFTEVTGVTENPYTLDGLTPATTYQFKVVANCSSTDASEESDVYEFQTLCEAIAALGYTENFDSYTTGNNVLPVCWNYINTTTYSSYQGYPKVYNSSANSPSNCLYLYSYAYYYGSTTTYDPQPQYAILPEMTGLAGKQVTLQAKGSYATSTFKIGTMSDPADASTFTPITEQELTTSYQEFEYIIPNNTDHYLAIMIDAATSSRTSNAVYIDDITIAEPPACPKPTSLTVSDITSDQATISWTENGSATSWQYSLNDGEPVTVNTNPYTITSLTALTDYTIKLRADCGGSQSEYTAVQNFSTTAVATVVGDSWSDDFEGDACGWQLINDDLTNKWCWGTAAHNGEGSKAIYVSNDNGTTNAYTVNDEAMVYATKLLTFINGKYEFSYDWIANGESSADYLRVALVPSSVILTAGTSTLSGFSRTTLPTGWIALDGGGKLNGVSAWQNKNVAVNVTAGNYYLVLAWRNDYSVGSQPPAAVDNVSITKLACPYDVADLAVTESSITTDRATVTWTAGEAEHWQVAYGTDANFDGATESIVNAATANLTGLTSSTVYYVRVRAYCGGTDYGSWSDPISFQTECEAITTFPYTQNFDSYTTGNNVLPICWNYINATTYSSYQVYPKVYNSNANSPSNCLYFYSYYSSYTDYDPKPQYAILPEMSGISGLRMKLYARASSTDYYYDATFHVGVMTNPADASTFTEIDSYTPTTTTYEQYTIPFDTYAGTGTYIAIMIEAADEDINSSYSYRIVYIDDITVEEIPSCLEPSNLEVAAASITTTSAEISWIAGSTEPAWDIYYSENNEAPTNVTTPSVAATSDNPATLDGLDPATTYYVWVRAHCSDADQSPWTGGISFSTPCDPITVDADNPFTENFDATDFPSSCWNTINSGTYAWARNTSYNHNEGGSASAYSGFYGDIYLVMPTLALVNDEEAVVRLTFWSYNTWTSSYDKNSVVLLDGNTETELWSPASVSQSWEKTTIDLSAYKGQNITLAFKYEGNNAHGWYVDDLKVEYHYTKSISANSWYAISAPTHNSGNNETVAGVTNLTDGTYDLLGYNEATATWQKPTSVLERGKGYIYRTNATKTLFFDGDVNSGNIDVSLTATNAAGTMKGWNLLGNPYAHTYALTRDCYSLSASGSWTAHATSYTMAVAEAVLVKSAGETFHFTETPATKSAPASTIAFTVSNDEFTDIAYARFSSEEGLPKISHLNPEAPMLSIDGYAIANLNEGTESFPMSFSGQGSYTLTVSGNTDVTGYLHLVDRLTGRDIDLLSTPSYSFTGSPVSDRFTVKLTPDANEGSSTTRFAIFDGNSLVINGEGTLEVYDVMGRRLMSAEVTGSEYRIPGSDLHTGVYVLRMNGNSQKIVIK